MKVGMYAVKDACTGFGVPMVQQNDACAMRDFENVVNSPNSLYKTKPNDFSLYKVGEYDTDVGIINSECVFIAEAASLLKEK